MGLEEKLTEVLGRNEEDLLSKLEKKVGLSFLKTVSDKKLVGAISDCDWLLRTGGGRFVKIAKKYGVVNGLESFLELIRQVGTYISKSVAEHPESAQFAGATRLYHY